MYFYFSIFICFYFRIPIHTPSFMCARTQLISNIHTFVSVMVENGFEMLPMA